ncbi:MAG: hypothetical protein IEMM0008_1244 [bacterium]|nr:MAG: hypothetical protein IEMM0008_1244 [bacterium]
MQRKMYRIFSVIILFVFLGLGQRGFSSPSAVFTTSPFNAALEADLNGVLKSEYESALSSYMGALVDSFAVSFATSDLIADTKIKSFTIGFGVVGGITSKLTLPSSVSNDLDRGIGAGASVHLGLAGSVFSKSLEDFDFILKLFIFPEIGSNVKFNAFSLGIKPRYHLMNGTGEGSVRWGGLTVSLSLDYSKIDLSLVDELSGSTTFTDDNGLTATGTITSSNASTSLSLFTITPEVMTNAKLLIFKPFLALGAVINVSSKMDIDGTINGGFTSNNGGTTGSGTLTLSGDEKAQFAIPYVRGGLAFDLWVVDLTFQGQVALANDTFFGGGVGLRVHF